MNKINKLGLVFFIMGISSVMNQENISSLTGKMMYPEVAIASFIMAVLGFAVFVFTE